MPTCGSSSLTRFGAGCRSAASKRPMSAEKQVGARLMPQSTNDAVRRRTVKASGRW